MTVLNFTNSYSQSYFFTLVDICWIITSYLHIFPLNTWLHTKKIKEKMKQDFERSYDSLMGLLAKLLMKLPVEPFKRWWQHTLLRSSTGLKSSLQSWWDAAVREERASKAKQSWTDMFNNSQVNAAARPGQLSSCRRAAIKARGYVTEGVGSLCNNPNASLQREKHASSDFGI